MGCLRLSSLFLFTVILWGRVAATNPPTVFNAQERYRMEIGANPAITFIGNNGKKLNARHGSSVYKTDGPFKRCVMGNNELDVCVQWGAHTVNVSVLDNHCLVVEAVQPTTPDGELFACFPYEEAQWYGGAERWYQNWPVQTVEINKPYVTGFDSSQSIVEPFWFNSNGASIYVSPEVPLFVDSNIRAKGELCVIARVAEPYNPRDTTLLRYEVCMEANAVEAQRGATRRYFGKPSGRPADAMFRDPIYSTWVRYGRSIDQNKMMALLEEIRNHSYPIGQIEIDDTWEPCYGASEFDTNRFPDIKNFTDTVHSLGGRVTAWLYPYINKDCNPAYQEALDNKRFIADPSGNTTMNWWCGTGGAVDVTKPEVSAWFVDRTRQLRDKTGLDSFKLDGGEITNLPSQPQLSGDQNLVPDIYVRKYVEAASNFSGLVEVRVGKRTQDLPVFVRMMDKDSRFGMDNGLKAVVTSLFQMNLVGYPFVLPDMIGGNQYNNEKTSKELFIRWLQANTFMPAIQFSVLPWDYDTETVEIARQYLALHSSYAQLLQTAADAAVRDGTPINTPIWWIAPDDRIALACNDEYLLAGTILVAPVLEEGAVQRDIYLPKGTWFNLQLGKVEGPTWLRNVSAPLDTLPYFVKA